MNTLISKPLAKRLTFNSDTMWVHLTDGRCLGIPLAFFPTLDAATPEQLMNYIISGGGVGLHWEELDEDLTVENLFLGVKKHSYNKKEQILA